MCNTISGFHSKEHAFLSSFHQAEVVLDDEIYPTVEHAYQAAKTPNRFERKVIQGATTPGRAKRLGGLLLSIREDWDGVKVETMRELIRQKFDPINHPDLCRDLLFTGNAALVEENTWRDYFWGVCGGVGQNWLGRLLMERRDQLAKIELQATA